MSVAQPSKKSEASIRLESPMIVSYDCHPELVRRQATREGPDDAQVSSRTETKHWVGCAWD